VFEVVRIVTANLAETTNKRTFARGGLETPAKTVGYSAILDSGEACDSSTVGMYI
jgi:hypothetical protein